MPSEQRRPPPPAATSTSFAGKLGTRAPLFCCLLRSCGAAVAARPPPEIDTRGACEASTALAGRAAHPSVAPSAANTVGAVIACSCLDGALAEHDGGGQGARWPCRSPPLSRARPPALFTWDGEPCSCRSGRHYFGEKNSGFFGTRLLYTREQLTFCGIFDERSAQL